MYKYKINEMFSSIDGESKRTGKLVTFIRVIGCNLSCNYCDSQWANINPDFTEMTLEEILDKCKEFGNKYITLTGGEPLLTKDIDKLIEALAENEYDICIETNGSVKISNLKYRLNSNIWFSMDYKSKYSGMQDKMIDPIEMQFLTTKDCLKFVVANKEDLEDAIKRIEEIEYLYNLREQLNETIYSIIEVPRTNYYFSPVFSQIEYKDIVEWLKEKTLGKSYRDRIVFQIQLHKIVWDPNKRGV